jgi:hypothetical protein
VFGFLPSFLLSLPLAGENRSVTAPTRRCLRCGERFTLAATGRPRRYSSDACRATHNDPSMRSQMGRWDRRM